MEKKKILYFILVPWKWIKQRPHFIAEDLSRDYDLTVAEKYPFNKKLRNHKDEKIHIKTYFQIPRDRIHLIHNINAFLQKCWLRKELNSSDVIWLTSPLQYTYLKNFDKSKVLVFDCMDDLIEFQPSTKRKAIFKRQEEKLYKDADLVIASSNFLASKLRERYGERDILLVNNALRNGIDSQNKQLPENINKLFNTDKFIITYIGTISNWFDFDLMRIVLEDNPNALLYLFGPLDTEIPKHDRIKYGGVVIHDLVFTLMEKSNLLIMPFVLNDLILSVNPVKLYEYIYSGKPCLAPLYGESESFGEYVYLYKSPKECSMIVSQLMAGQGAKLPIEECRKFTFSNTWFDRMKVIKAELEKKLKGKIRN